ncbi:hypothetical protein FN846DRAFT_1029799 [Sphaerosporella brunnea]|uniref:3-oxoacyl-reductase n=1 Tax=Sphaerosporella brunnea TaxID=1250544 RepID=A0A5J5EHB0_9PEZI|nr:hypothetical protein FN846DRAFT_1029799 [Sphaerosporella brunnea]
MSAHKTILITGASRGIGYGIAHRFATLGASIVLLSRSAAAVDTARGSLPKIPGFANQSHRCIVGDVGDAVLWDDIRRNEVAGKQKDIDILINAAGVTHHSLLVATRTGVVEEVLRTNLLGTTLACRAVAKNMLGRKAGGCIINVASLLGLHKPTAGSTVYAASKAGVVGLTRSLAAELGPAGVRTNVIVPGYIETDMTARMSEVARIAALKATPLGRFGHVDEVADAAVFLVENGFVNGAEIVIDGGLACT